jgi:hypothetical protein
LLLSEGAIPVVSNLLAAIERYAAFGPRC